MTDRLAVVARHLAADGIGRRPLPHAVGATCASLLAIEHSGLLLVDGEGNLVALAATTPMMALVEDLEVRLGAGPCIDAYRFGHPVEEIDLEHADSARWLGFHTPALAAGVRGVFAFPLQVAGASIGSLNLARSEPGPMTTGHHIDAVALAGVVAQLALTLPLDAIDGSVDVEDLLRHHAVVHQATGMIGAQLDVPMAVGLAVLRARAFADDRSVDEVAADVVQRRVRFDP